MYTLSAIIIRYFSIALLSIPMTQSNQSIDPCTPFILILISLMTLSPPHTQTLQKIDEIAENTNEETMIELDMKQQSEQKEQNTEDLDKWLNKDDRDDDWGNFDEDGNNTETQDQNASALDINDEQNEDDKVQINEVNVDDFDNWDHDPFAEADLFETEENAKDSKVQTNDEDAPNGHNDQNINKNEKENENQNDEKQIKSTQESIDSVASVSKIKEIVPSKTINDGQTEQQQTAVIVNE